MSEFTVLSRESRDHESPFPVILVPMVQEGLYVAQQASNVIRGRAWGTPNHSQIQEQSYDRHDSERKTRPGTPTSCRS